MAESFVTFAVKFWKGGLPFLTNHFENIWWNGELGASGIDNSWVAGVWTYLLHCLTSIGHSLSFKSPRSKPVGEVLKCLEAICTVDNLGRVVATKECIWCLIHFLGGYTEADHGVVDDAIVLKGPQVMELLFAHIFVRWKSQNSIWLLAKPLRLVQSQELEICTFAVFKLQLNLNKWLWSRLERLNTSIVLPNESLELGWSVSKLWRSFRKDLVWVWFVHVISLSSASFS